MLRGVAAGGAVAVGLTASGCTAGGATATSTADRPSHVSAYFVSANAAVKQKEGSGAQLGAPALAGSATERDGTTVDLWVAGPKPGTGARSTCTYLDFGVTGSGACGELNKAQVSLDGYTSGVVIGNVGTFHVTSVLIAPVGGAAVSQQVVDGYFIVPASVPVTADTRVTISLVDAGEKTLVTPPMTAPDSQTPK